MIYQTGTITTKAGQTKITGTGTRWKDNLNGISEGCPISYLIDNTVFINTVLSVNSDTEINLTYPVPVAAAAAKYQIATFVLDSMSDGVRKMLANQQYIQYFLHNMDTWMTQDGIVEIKTPTGETVKLESIIELKKLIDGKFDKKGGIVNGTVFADDLIKSTSGKIRATNKDSDIALEIQATDDNKPKLTSIRKGGPWREHILPNASGTLMQVGDYGFGGVAITVPAGTGYDGVTTTGVLKGSGVPGTPPDSLPWGSVLHLQRESGRATQLGFWKGNIATRSQLNGVWDDSWIYAYTQANTTKDSNGNLKAASPVIKLFADSIELNDESEGVEMEHIGIGHYLIKGVVGFNADGAWGVNNGFVIPQDHNGKNMVLIDYEVRPDGDIEVFVFHQQNAEMPERFQNKRIKYFDEEGKPVYFENYEPCDIPESRWIDMRVEMPPNSLYNQKLAEAERLAKLEAERLAEEEDKRAAEEAERAEQEATERKQYDLGDNDVLL